MARFGYTLSKCGVTFALVLLVALPAFGISEEVGNLQEGDDLSDPPQIVIVAPADITYRELDPEAINEMDGSFFVKSNTDWVVTVKDEGETKGHMTEWDGQNYGPRKLEHPLKVVAQREIDISRPQTQKSLTSLSAKDAADSCESLLLLQSGARTDGDGREMGVTFKQKVDWEDEPLEQGRVYRIRVVFTGSTVV